MNVFTKINKKLPKFCGNVQNLTMLDNCTNWTMLGKVVKRSKVSLNI